MTPSGVHTEPKEAEVTELDEVREKLVEIRATTLRQISEVLDLLESEQREQRIEGGISEDDADMLFNEMSWEVKFDPRAVTDKRAGFLHATLIIKPRAILATPTESEEPMK